MDFGFGKFLEMFEERFGRHPTTGLLIAIALAILVFCANLVLVQGVMPLTDLIRGSTDEIKLDRDSVLEFATRTSLVVLVVYAGAMVLLALASSILLRLSGGVLRDAREAGADAISVSLMARIIYNQTLKAKYNLSDKELDGMFAELDQVRKEALDEGLEESQIGERIKAVFERFEEGASSQ